MQYNNIHNNYRIQYLFVCRTTSLMRFRLKNNRKYCRGDAFRGDIFLGPGLLENGLFCTGSGGITRNQTPAILHSV